MQRHPQAWKGMCCSETSWKAQNLRRTQTAATVEGVTQTAKQDFKLYSQTIYPGKVSPNLEKNETTMAPALMWSYCYHSDLYNIILGQCTALLHCLLLHKSLLLPAFHTLQMFFFYFSAIKSKSRLFAAWSAASVDIANTPMQTELQHIAWRDPSILNGYHISPSLH